MATPEDVIGPINLGNPVEFTILELAETLIGLTGSRSKLRRLPLPADDPRQRRPDIGRARALLAWEPKVGLEAGLRKTIDYFDKLLSKPHRAPAGLQLKAATVANFGVRAVGR
jgi:UDP-glucuronate decarboxylase